MKFWKKIYLVTFLLFLVFLNGGIFFVFQAAYASNMREEKKRTASENKLIVKSLGEEIAAFEQTEVPAKSDIEIIMQDYEEMYKENRLKFELWQAENCMYADGVPGNWNRAGDTLTLVNEKGVDRLVLVSEFKVWGHTYCLITIRTLTEVTLLWDRIRLIFLVSSGGLSVMLAVLLYFVMRRITLPLNRLSHLTREVAEGNYMTIDIKGNDEIAELGKDFNVMTAAVQKRIEFQERFTGNLAHELRTPLTSICGYSEYLLRGNPEEGRKYQALDYMVRESRRMQKMTEQLLMLARFRGDEFEKEKVKLYDICREAYLSCKPILEEKHICFQMTGEESAETIFGVRELLICLFRNLLENAVRACLEGGHISMEISGQTVCVCDDGVGMKAEEICKITEPFYRIDKARSSKGGGTGLGLALCSEIVRLHGAELIFESQTAEEGEDGKNTGTKVTIFFTVS